MDYSIENKSAGIGLIIANLLSKNCSLCCFIYLVVCRWLRQGIILLYYNLGYHKWMSKSSIVTPWPGIKLLATWNIDTRVVVYDASYKSLVGYIREVRKEILINNTNIDTIDYFPFLWKKSSKECNILCKKYLDSVIQFHDKITIQRFLCTMYIKC